MRCIDCGREMERGTVEALAPSVETWNIFTSDLEKAKTGLQGFFRYTVAVPMQMEEQAAWHCPECKKVLMWVRSRE